jgi:hypothetical protein
LGTSNPHNVVKSTMTALRNLQSAKQVARRRGISLQHMFGLPEGGSSVATETALEAAGGESA